MEYHWFVRKLNERLWLTEGQGSQARPIPTYQNERLHGDILLLLLITALTLKVLQDRFVGVIMIL